ncbi:MAG: YHS domain-containing (seleno)protein [Cyanobacteria bacterium J06648_11]
MVGLSLAIGCAPATPNASAEEFVSPAETLETEVSSTVADAVSSPEQPVEIASTSSDPAPAAVFVENGIAIRGADVVAYFVEDRYVPGNAEFTYEWGGAIWQFANAENRDAFARSPARYAPQYGGFCAWAVSQNYTAPVDPAAWEIVDGKLYLNFNASVQRRWQRDIPGNIAKGDRNWPGVLNN